MTPIVTCGRGSRPAGLSEHDGVIINIGSTSGAAVDPSMAPYNASEASVHGMTAASLLRLELF